jgi:ABC-type nickel/cobalt efflux system permease component RcnA
MPDYWTASEIAERSDAEVIDYINQFHHGHAAQAEMQRRHMDSMNRSATRLESLTHWIIGLTVVLVVLTAALLVLTVVLVAQDP